MQFSKLQLAVCTAALCGGVAGLHASDDTPAQAAARAAVLKQLQTTEVGTSPTNSVPAPVTGDTPAQATARAAVLKNLSATESAPTAAPVACDA